MEDSVQAPLILQCSDWLSGEFLARFLAAKANFPDLLTNESSEWKSDIVTEAA